MKNLSKNFFFLIACILTFSSFIDSKPVLEVLLSVPGKFMGTTYSQVDSSRKKWTTRKPLPVDSARKIARYLLDSNPVFKEDWNNEVLFEHNKDYSELPENVTFTLLGKDEEFYMNWYGYLSWGFGMRRGKLHAGLDICLSIGDTVACAFDGVVRYAGVHKKGYGRCVIVRHLNGLETLYGHLSKICVDTNEFLKAGQLVGLGGSSGKSTGPHLHFETRYKDIPFNPFLLIDSLSHKLRSNTITLSKEQMTYHPNLTPKNKRNSNKTDTKKTHFDPSKTPNFYTVKKGDSIWGISQRYGLTEQQLKKLNSLKSDKLQIGQKLKLK